MKILFFGIHEIGQRSLEKLLGTDEVEIVGVVTKYDTVFQTYSVSDFAKKNHLQCYSLRFINCQYVYDLFKKLEFDLIVVAGFHLIIPEEILNLAKRAAINLHDSLLPQYKGPNASKWCIINGEKKTGVTVHQMSGKIDEGRIIAQKEVEILPVDTAGTLFSRLASIGSDLLVEVVSLIQKNTLSYPNVNGASPSYYSYPTINDLRIKWNSLSANQIYSLVRGLNPSPGAFFFYNKEKFKVFEMQILSSKSHLKEGTIMELCDEYFIVSTLTWDIKINNLRKQLHYAYSIREFIDENRLKVFDILM